MTFFRNVLFTGSSLSGNRSFTRAAGLQHGPPCPLRRTRALHDLSTTLRLPCHLGVCGGDPSRRVAAPYPCGARPSPDAAASLKMHGGEAALFEVNDNECHELVLLTGDH